MILGRFDSTVQKEFNKQLSRKKTLKKRSHKTVTTRAFFRRNDIVKISLKGLITFTDWNPTRQTLTDRFKLQVGPRAHSRKQNIIVIASAVIYCTPYTLQSVSLFAFWPYYSRTCEKWVHILNSHTEEQQ